jgi:hypothetical protein
MGFEKLVSSFFSPSIEVKVLFRRMGNKLRSSVSDQEVGQTMIEKEKEQR